MNPHLLASELRAGKPAHAYLLAGADPGSLRRAALVLAQGLNCLATAPTLGEPCGHCPSCEEIGRGVFADVSLDPPRLRLQEVKDELARLAERPARGRYRVAVFQDAPNMTREAQNALLKTLEEPAARSVLILLAPDAESLLPTVVSRCRIVAVQGASAAAVARQLEQEGHEGRRAAFAALWAGENLDQARTLAGRDDFDAVRAEAVEFVLGAVGPRAEPALELVQAHEARLASAQEAGLWLNAVGAVLRALMVPAGAGQDFHAGAFTAQQWQDLRPVSVADGAALAMALGRVQAAMGRHAMARLSLEAALLELRTGTAGPRAGRRGL